MGKTYFGETQIFEIDGEKITIGTYGYGLQKELGQLAKAGEEQESLDRFLMAVIKEWTLKDEKGADLPISVESFNRLSGPFMNKIIEAANVFNKITPEQVKN